MGLIHWFSRLFARRSVTRDITRLDGAQSSGDAIRERIDLTGGPLKPGHHRRALRDQRLLPKPKTVASTVRFAVGVKRPKVMTRAEADRLFSTTMRTRDRGARDLTTDEDQLRRLGLPIWRSEADLATALEISERNLLRFAIHRERERTPHYVTFAIPKRSGGERLIMAPKRQLKALQRRLHDLLVSRLPVSDAAHGFRTGRSIRSGAEPHVGKRLVVHLDLQDFFPTVTFARVRGLLIAYGYSYPVATSLAVLMTEAVRQPVEIDGELFHVPVGTRHCVQGAPTSPGLCNAIALRLDRRLTGLARKFGIAYTRYADDMTFSGDLDRETAKRLLHHVRAIIHAEGFAPNESKTALMTAAGRQTVTGVVVNRDLGLSRQERRRMRAALHQVARDAAAGADVGERRAALDGKLAYLAMLNPAQAERLTRGGA